MTSDKTQFYFDTIKLAAEVYIASVKQEDTAEVLLNGVMLSLHGARLEDVPALLDQRREVADDVSRAAVMRSVAEQSLLATIHEVFDQEDKP